MCTPSRYRYHRHLHSFPTRRSSDLVVLVTTTLLALFGRRLNVLLAGDESATALGVDVNRLRAVLLVLSALLTGTVIARSEEHTSELQSHVNLVCRLLLEKKKKMWYP